VLPGRRIPDLDSVHVFLAELPHVIPFLDRLKAVLSPDEAGRAGRFHFERDRQRYAAARGLLRVILAACSETRPGDLWFQHNEFGKPRLPAPALSFNLAHSHDRILIAIAARREVGVDIERIEPERSVDDVARRYFSGSERVALAAAPEAERARAFFSCWTRKEADLKALGEGLSRPLDSFSVPVTGACDVVLWSGSGAWTVRDVETGAADYVAAVAAAGKGWRLALHALDQDWLRQLVEPRS
jgi:4'-phosphopantetheinyl transferase